MLIAHRILGTWQEQVDVYVALSEFARTKFIEGGLPSNRIVVKPNFVHPDPGKKPAGGDYALFVGRLAEEKGLHTLVEAWKRFGLKTPLRIVGDGPMRTMLESEVRTHRLDAVSLCGYLSHEKVQEYMHGARFLVLPSLWFEGFPLAIAEAFACGLPVLCSRQGSLAEIVKDGVTGLHFEPGNAADMAARVEWAWTHGAEIADMSCAARAEYEAKYTAEKNYRALMKTYQLARSFSQH
jgi:glycosyltransferase involved in cell wall biosynthesis